MHISVRGIVEKDDGIILIHRIKPREYGTFNFFNDMKKDDYQGNIGPDISGFIKSEIDER